MKKYYFIQSYTTRTSQPFKTTKSGLVVVTSKSGGIAVGGSASLFSGDRSAFKTNPTENKIKAYLDRSASTSDTHPARVVSIG